MVSKSILGGVQRVLGDEFDRCAFVVGDANCLTCACVPFVVVDRQKLTKPRPQREIKNSGCRQNTILLEQAVDDYRDSQVFATL